MLRFLLSIEDEVLGYNVADMTACSTDENLLRTSSSNATPACSETVQRFNDAQQRFGIYPLSYEALQRFIEALSNLTHSSFAGLIAPVVSVITTSVILSSNKIQNGGILHWLTHVHLENGR